MIGYTLVTPQTPKDGTLITLNKIGLLVNAVLVHEGIDIVK